MRPLGRCKANFVHSWKRFVPAFWAEIDRADSAAWVEVHDVARREALVAPPHPIDTHTLPSRLKASLLLLLRRRRWVPIATVDPLRCVTFSRRRFVDAVAD